MKRTEWKFPMAGANLYDNLLNKKKKEKQKYLTK